MNSGYWANLLRQIYSALASQQGCSARNVTFSAPSSAQGPSRSALASGLAFSSKGHVRRALLAPSGLVWLATWPSTAAAVTPSPIEDVRARHYDSNSLS